MSRRVGQHPYDPQTARLLIDHGAAYDLGHDAIAGVAVFSPPCAHAGSAICSCVCSTQAYAAILLDAGATISAADEQGATPLTYAERNDLLDMVDFLRRHGAE